MEDATANDSSQEDDPDGNDVGRGNGEKTPSRALVTFPRLTKLSALQAPFGTQYIGSSPRRHAYGQGKNSHAFWLKKGMIKWSKSFCHFSKLGMVTGRFGVVTNRSVLHSNGRRSSSPPPLLSLTNFNCSSNSSAPHHRKRHH